MRKNLYVSMVLGMMAVLPLSAQTVTVADFENLEIGAEGHMSVSTEADDERTEFTSGSFTFASGCMSDWEYWYFFGYANRTSSAFESLDDQWNNVVGGGYDGSSNYGVSTVLAMLLLMSMAVLWYQASMSPTLPMPTTP